MVSTTRSSARVPHCPTFSTAVVCADTGSRLNNSAPAETLGKEVKEVKEAISVIHKLEGLGLQHEDIKLPQCIVLGEQSTGKSSVIEAISGITTPRSTDTCTRCPLYIIMEQSPPGSEWYAEVTLRKSYSFDSKKRSKFPGWISNPNSTPIIEPIGSTHSQPELEHIIANAQTVALSPYPGVHCEFSPNVVCIRVSHPAYEDLSFYDLPGIIGQTEHEDKQYLVKFVRDLVCDYIKNSLVLVVCSLENDIANSTAAGLARQWKVTDHCVGILTKPDRMPVGTREDKLNNILKGEQFKLGHGYFVVKNPGQSELDKKLTHEEARVKEKEFFASKEPWASSLEVHSDRFGTEHLQLFLSRILAAQSVNHLPGIYNEIVTRLNLVDKELSSLPEPPSNPTRAINDAIVKFTNHVRNEIQADYPFRDWRSQWRALHQSFFQDLSSMRPTLRIGGKLDMGIFPVPAAQTQDDAICISDSESEENTAAAESPKKRKIEEVTPSSMQSTPHRFAHHRKVFTLDDTAKDLEYAKSRTLDLDPKVVEHLICQTFDHWNKPLDALLESLSCDIAKMMKSIFNTKFGCWNSSAIYPQAWKIVEEIMSSSLAEQRTMAMDSLQDERHGPSIFFETTATQDYEAMREKYRQARINHRLRNYRAECLQHTGRAIDAEKLKKDEKAWSIITQEPYDKEINLVAKVTSYYEMASRRFYEAVAMRIQSKFFERLCTSLHDDLESGLGINDPATSQETAKYLLAEPSHRLEHRHQLLAKRGKLDEALMLVQGVVNKYGQPRTRENDGEDEIMVDTEDV